MSRRRGTLRGRIGETRLESRALEPGTDSHRTQARAQARSVEQRAMDDEAAPGAAYAEEGLDERGGVEPARGSG